MVMVIVCRHDVQAILIDVDKNYEADYYVMR